METTCLYTNRYKMTSSSRCSLVPKQTVVFDAPDTSDAAAAAARHHTTTTTVRVSKLQPPAAANTPSGVITRLLQVGVPRGVLLEQAFEERVAHRLSARDSVRRVHGKSRAHESHRALSQLRDFVRFSRVRVFSRWK